MGRGIMTTKPRSMRGILGITSSSGIAAESELRYIKQHKNMENTPTEKRAAIARIDLLAALDLWGSIAHDENGGFVERFCPNAWILTQVSWDSENMRFVYILDCGQHVADSVKITEWLEFISANDKCPSTGANGNDHE